MSQRRKLVYRMPINEKGAKVVFYFHFVFQWSLVFLLYFVQSKKTNLENTSSGKRIPASRELFAQEMTVKDLQFTIPYCGTNDEACLVIRHHQGQQVKNFWSNLVLELPPQVRQQIKLKKLKECVSLPLSFWEIIFTAATGLTAFLPFLCLVTIRVVVTIAIFNSIMLFRCDRCDHDQLRGESHQGLPR